MRGQRFKLERVLRVRRIEEELAREHFQSCEQVARRAEEVAENIGAEIAKAQEELVETRRYRRTPPEDLVMAQETLESLDRTLVEQKRRAGDLRREAEAIRTEWEQSRGDMRALERLEERFWHAARGEEYRAELRELDESAQRRVPSGPASPIRTAPSRPEAPRADEGAKDSPGANPR